MDLFEVVKEKKPTSSLNGSCSIPAMSTVSGRMRAVVLRSFGGEENLKVENVPLPSLKADEVLIRVHSAGINPVDTYVRSGTYAKLPKLPAIIGREVAGVVDEVAPGADSFKKGDRVFAALDTGGYAEYVACHKNSVFPLSEKLSYNQGTAIHVAYFTAYRALIHKAKLKAGETVLVHGGSGAVGVAAIQIAKLKGAKVVGTAGSPQGLSVVKQAGADHAMNHKDVGYLHNAVNAIGGKGFDIIIENLANVNLGTDLSVLNTGARIAVVGCRGTVEINPRSLMMKEASIIGVMLYAATEADDMEMREEILKGIEDGWVKPIIGEEYALEEAAKAHHNIIYNTGARGKIVFKIL